MRVCAGAWERWWEGVAAERERAAEEERKKEVVRRVVVRLSRAGMATGFETWKLAVEVDACRNYVRVGCRGGRGGGCGGGLRFSSIE